MISINTNTGAMVALQYLNQTQASLMKTQAAINSGLKVASAKDDGATFAIAQNMRGDVADPIDVGDGSSAEFQHQQGHGLVPVVGAISACPQ